MKCFSIELGFQQTLHSFVLSNQNKFKVALDRVVVTVVVVDCRHRRCRNRCRRRRRRRRRLRRRRRILKCYQTIKRFIASISI